MKTNLQIRPNTPDSCPLLWERADEESQPEMRIMHGFTPKWFQTTLAEIESDLERIREELTPCEIILTDIEDTTPDERVVDFYRLCGKLWKMDIRDLVPTTMSR
jgi:hypothetical protein